jgi:hypothetical protein
MLFGFRKVQSKVGAWTGYFLNVFMLNELNVDRPDEGVHHEADQPAHLQRNAISLFVSSSRGAAVSKYYFSSLALTGSVNCLLAFTSAQYFCKLKLPLVMLWFSVLEKWRICRSLLRLEQTAVFA